MWGLIYQKRLENIWKNIALPRLRLRKCDFIEFSNDVLEVFSRLIFVW